MHGFEDTNTGQEHIALVLGNVADEDSPFAAMNASTRSKTAPDGA